MKTFKIISLTVLEKDQERDIPLVDGLIINKEDGKKTWLIEAYLDNQYSEYFQKAKDSSQEMEVEVVITHEANPPAPFRTTILGVQVFEEHVSILLQGFLSTRTRENTGELLEGLVKKGLSGEELIKEFKLVLKRKSRNGNVREQSYQ
ncbi:YwpF-like family protein [Heyndrickxia acidicola]|uniref:YwpF-like family protein n=1 Tax=Heyndrickxia acidicola TaxID=209389 RepID=A0ABU6MEX6_9BACI|nr:YwpF-like family protein [Heyndrickxia acidicola]MED1202942.1 YwpF-like family protein [Heyndrickxia acidicola]